jgi:asparagine synthase (glutamine-hydrolysing)
MLSDVPLGAFLSGGIDSTTIVAIMQSVSSRPIKTFTIGFDDKKYNEAEHASQIAKFLGTEHTELYVKPQDILNVIPLLPAMYDEPFSDSSQIPTYLVAKLAKETVTVALTGDAGDELFAGYNRYLFASNIWSKIDKIPFWLRNIMVGVIQSLPPSKWDTVFFALKFLLPSRYRIKNFGDKLHKASSILLSSDQNKLYNKLNNSMI